MIDKDHLREMLQNTIAEVTFEKTDGTIRVMAATLMHEHLPIIREDDPTTHYSKRDENPNVIAVWDMDKNDWRSFRVSSVLHIKIIHPSHLFGVYYHKDTI